MRAAATLPRALTEGGDGELIGLEEEQPLGLEVGQDLLAGREAIEPLVRAPLSPGAPSRRRSRAPRDWLRRPASKSLKSCAGVTLTTPVPNAGVDQDGIAHDGHPAVHERHLGALADQVAIALVVRMNSDAGVAQQRLRSGGRHRKHLVAALDPGSRCAEAALLLPVVDLKVADGRSRQPGRQLMSRWASVDEPFHSKSA